MDYWDYLGWQDRFASGEYSARQRRYARLGQVSTVYTPGFVYNGHEWRGFLRGAVSEFPPGKETGELLVQVDKHDAQLRFRPGANMEGPFTANIALLGFGLRTAVGAGENRGRELRHEFVVVAHSASSLTTDGADYTGHATVPSSKGEAQRYALVVWISSRQNPAPLQAVGAYLPDDG